MSHLCVLRAFAREMLDNHRIIAGLRFTSSGYSQKLNIFIDWARALDYAALHPG